MSIEVPETVVVELVDEKRGFSADAELPSGMPAGKICRGLLALLKKLEPERYSLCSSVALHTASKELQPYQTLASLGLWDGSTLFLRDIHPAFGAGSGSGRPKNPWSDLFSKHGLRPDRSPSHTSREKEPEKSSGSAGRLRIHMNTHENTEGRIPG